MTPQTPAPAVARDGFVTYDELSGSDLDASRWTPARLPLPTGGRHIALEPDAQLAVGDGEVRGTIPRFAVAHAPFRAADSAKHLVLSTRRFELPPDRPVTFAADLAVENLDGEPAGSRRGVAAFPGAGLHASKRVFSVCGTSSRVFAMHEHLAFGGPSEPFVHVVESPYADFDDDFTRPRACEITLDRSRSTAAWRVDGRAVYEARTLIPDGARIAFGIFTM